MSRSRHQTPDTADERISDLPPRYYPRGGGRGRRDNRRDDRRRTTDDEETVLDSQDVSSADRVNNHMGGGSQESPQMDNGLAENATKPQREAKGRLNRPPPSRRSDAKPKEAMFLSVTV
ncbi:hypothetical protein NQ315_011511 [Exocentrus adspersus]|uniref:Uncharacterized protein n=1 Tax=Exocentrus adspersus TaxID=1586481 RepID=A0AAV8VV73_9CUCU|nr:hypothetical protein NQ315_011511 [Exocentrus adspersus]